MEARKITVVQTKNQKKSVVMTAATTLGELKEALNEVGIDYEGMTFYEGLSKTELKNNESILPHDIERNGTVTNELVFMLTNTDKKIRSGAMLRPELYAYIKTNSLQAEVQRKFGKNYTMCKTADLQLIVDTHMKGNKNTTKPVVETPAKEEPKIVVKNEETNIETPVTVAPQDNSNIKEAVRRIVEILYQADLIEYDTERNEILSLLDGDAKPTASEHVKDDMSSPYSDAEIARMMREM